MYFGDSVNTSPYFRGEAGAKIDDPRGKAVKFSSGQFVLGTAADEVIGIIPVTNDQSLEQGDPIDIVWKDMTLALAGGRIAAGDVLACDANGALVKASATGGTIGIAMEAAASGQYFHMIVERGTFTAAAG